MQNISYGIILLSILVLIHEIGHFVAAKIFQVRILKFSIGFGNKLIGIKINHTEYIISGIPLGGYVKMLGESELEYSLEKKKDIENFFIYKSPIKKIIIAFFGPLFNIIFSFVMLFSIYFYEKDSIKQINYLKRNESFLNEKKIKILNEKKKISLLIIKNKNILKIKKEKKTKISLPINTLKKKKNKKKKTKKDKKIKIKINIKNIKKNKKINISIIKNIEKKKEKIKKKKYKNTSFIEVFNKNNNKSNNKKKILFFNNIYINKKLIIKNLLFNNIGKKNIITEIKKKKLIINIMKIKKKHLFSLFKEKNTEYYKIYKSNNKNRKKTIEKNNKLFLYLYKSIFVSLINNSIVKEISGPIMIMNISNKIANKNKMLFLYLMILISLNLAILNLLPIPMLDGNYILIFLLEIIRKKKIKEKTMYLINSIGIILILFITLIALYNDIKKIVFL